MHEAPDEKHERHHQHEPTERDQRSCPGRAVIDGPADRDVGRGCCRSVGDHDDRQIFVEHDRRLETVLSRVLPQPEVGASRRRYRSLGTDARGAGQLEGLRVEPDLVVGGVSDPRQHVAGAGVRGEDRVRPADRDILSTIKGIERGPPDDRHGGIRGCLHLSRHIVGAIQNGALGDPEASETDGDDEGHSGQHKTQRVSPLVLPGPGYSARTRGIQCGAGCTSARPRLHRLSGEEELGRGDRQRQ